MKRILSLILTAVMLLSVGLPLIPTVIAEGAAEETPEPPVNFAASLVWSKTVGRRLRDASENIAICVHIILGLPGESGEDMLRTVKDVASLKPDQVKI